jgi:hypothetical protein
MEAPGRGRKGFRPTTISAPPETRASLEGWTVFAAFGGSAIFRRIALKRSARRKSMTFVPCALGGGARKRQSAAEDGTHSTGARPWGFLFSSALAQTSLGAYTAF